MKVWDLAGCPFCGAVEGCAYLAGGDCTGGGYPDPREEAAAEADAAAWEALFAEVFAPGAPPVTEADAAVLDAWEEEVF